MSRRERAKLSLSQTDRYLVVLNLFSRATSCSYVNAVLARLGLPALLSLADFFFLLLLLLQFVPLLPFVFPLLTALFLIEHGDDPWDVDDAPFEQVMITLSLVDVIGELSLLSGSKSRL